VRSKDRGGPTLENVKRHKKEKALGLQKKKEMGASKKSKQLKKEGKRRRKKYPEKKGSGGKKTQVLSLGLIRGEKKGQDGSFKKPTRRNKERQVHPVGRGGRES